MFADGVSPELEQWMMRNRLRNASKLLSGKLETAERRGFKSVQIPLAVLRTLVKAISQ